jgi:murein DD-endopeptidase MepM/ murein hydrolase activator NlpD
VVLFKGLLGLKKVLTLLLFAVKKPAFWLYKALIFPILALGYRLLRFVRRRFAELVEFLKDGALRILANKYAIHAAIIVVALLVTTTNIYASETPAPTTDGQDHSILSGVVDNGSEDVLVEEATQDGAPPVNGDSSYLGAQAVSTQDAAAAGGTDQQYNGTESGAYADDDISGSDETYVDESPMANAVRPQPEGGDQGAPPTRTKVEEHVVQDGETLGSIAQEYGLSVGTILAANKIHGYLIHPGDKLRILPMDGIAYTVKKGDTLNKIATTYKSDADKILQANGLADASDLSVGDEIILPDGRAPAPPAPPRSSSIASNLRNIFTPKPGSGGDRFLWPTAVHRITQLFGAWEWGMRHTGVDIAGPSGTPIYAADDGVVISAGWNRGGYGNMIIIDHGSGWFTRYGHSSKLLVKAGDVVKKGDVISLMGSTGRSTGPHLHFEIMTGDVHHRINPLNYIR